VKPAPDLAPLAVALRDRRRVTIREVQPDDADAFEAAFERLSAQARYSRFMGSVRALAPSVRESAVNPVPGRELAVVAVCGEGGYGLIVGGARYFVEADGETCEFAVTVADDWQRLGLAPHLMQALMRAARSHGLQRMRGFVLASNTPMLGLAQRLGFEVTRCAEDRAVRLISTRLTEN